MIDCCLGVLLCQQNRSGDSLENFLGVHNMAAETTASFAASWKDRMNYFHQQSVDFVPIVRVLNDCLSPKDQVVGIVVQKKESPKIEIDHETGFHQKVILAKKALLVGNTKDYSRAPISKGVKS